MIHLWFILEMIVIYYRETLLWPGSRHISLFHKIDGVFVLCLCLNKLIPAEV